MIGPGQHIGSPARWCSDHDCLSPRVPHSRSRRLVALVSCYYRLTNKVAADAWRREYTLWRTFAINYHRTSADADAAVVMWIGLSRGARISHDPWYDRPAHHRCPAEPSERHRRGNGRGNTAHRLLADPELLARLLYRPDRRTLPPDRPGGSYPGARR